GAWSACPDGAGVVWLGGPDGLIRYDDNARKNINIPYKALIRSLTSEADTLHYNGAYFADHSTRSNRLLIHSHINTIRFQCAAPAYDAVEEVRFRFKLDG